MHSNANVQLIKSLLWCNLSALLLATIVIAAVRILNRHGKRITLPVSNGMLLLLGAYFASIAAITIIPLPFSEASRRLPATVNLVPLVNTLHDLFYPLKSDNWLLAADVLRNILGNILMFLPLGILLPVANKKFHSVKKILVFALLFSTGIEIAQLVSRVIGNYRQTDIDDVIFNTLGALTGYFLYKAMTGKKRPGPLAGTH